MAFQEKGTDQPGTVSESWSAPSAVLPTDHSLQPWRPAARRWGRRGGLGLAVVILLLPLGWAGWMHFGPRWVLQDMARTYAQARTLQLSGLLREDIGLPEPGGAPVQYGRAGRFTLAYAAPNLYSGTVGSGRDAVHTVIDGQTAWVETSRLQTVYVCPAPRTLPPKWSQPGGPPAAGAGGIGDPLALVAGAANLQQLTNVHFNVDPREDWLSRLAGPPHTWTISFQQAGAADTFAVWIDRSNSTLRQAAVQTKQIGRVITYEATELGPVLGAEAFTYTPPAGMRQVAVRDLDEVEAAVRAAQGRQQGS